jgi:hypothetical protein
VLRISQNAIILVEPLSVDASMLPDIATHGPMYLRNTFSSWIYASHPSDEHEDPELLL